jgi:predicted nuclease of predicted toxin-antitoxin system
VLKKSRFRSRPFEMKVLIDMNLSPSWVQALEDRGFLALHWSSVGDGGAPDAVVLAWAKNNGYIVFTNDLDFGAILAITRAASPSVIQVRTQDLSPAHLIDLVVRGLQQHEAALERGALISVDEQRLRSRVLPLVD